MWECRGKRERGGKERMGEGGGKGRKVFRINKKIGSENRIINGCCRRKVAKDIYRGGR